MEDGPEPSPQEARTTTATFRSFIPEQRVFNRYLIREELGRGGRGVVFLAQDMRLFSLIALKFMADELVREPEALEELRHETLVSRKITHPHIMRIYDFEQDSSAAAISMEYVEGATLSQLRYKRERHCFDTEEIKPWMLQLADALHYAHREARIVHRDLKPSNLMIGVDGKLKITDFGIASVIADSISRVTRTHLVSGTLPYMSPQQALGDLPRESDDIYSFGAVIYELLTSKPPFFRGNVAVQIHKAEVPLMAERRAELGRGGPPIPKAWEEIVASCLAKTAEDRPLNAKEIAEWIEKGTRDSTTGARLPAQSTPSPAAIPRPQRNAWLPLAAIVLFLAAAVLWALNQPHDSRRSDASTAPAPPSPAPLTPPPFHKTAPIVVNTMPSGADVFLNGDAKGKSPLQLEEVGVGSWRLKVQREGYESTELIVDVREDGVTQPPLIELVRKSPTPPPMLTPIPSTPAQTPPPAPPVSTPAAKVTLIPSAPVPAPPPAPPIASPNSGAIMAVVNGYAQAMQMGDASAYAALCAPRVGYFDEGQHAKDYVRRSREAFARLFTNYEVRNLRNISIRETPGVASAEVSFSYEWSAVCVSAHSVNHRLISPGPKRGTVTDTLDVQQIDGHWLITKFGQKKW